MTNTGEFLKDAKIIIPIEGEKPVKIAFDDMNTLGSFIYNSGEEEDNRWNCFIDELTNSLTRYGYLNAALWERILKKYNYYGGTFTPTQYKEIQSILDGWEIK